MNNLYLLTSTDEYLIKKKVDEILKTKGLDEEILENYDLDENDITDLISCLNTESIFDDLRVFWLKNPSIVESNIKVSDYELDSFNKFCANKSNDNILIISSTNYSKDNKLSQIINKFFEKIDLDKTSISLDEYMNKYILDNDLKIGERERKEVLQRSKDYQTLENNLIKLSSYADGSEITMDMINLLTNREMDSKIYDITSNMFEGNNGQAYVALKNLLDENVSPSIILSNIKNNVILLMYAQKLYAKGKTPFDIAQELNISSGRAYHLVRYVRTLGEKKIETFVKQLCKINVDVRSGNGDELTMLELFVLQK